MCNAACTLVNYFHYLLLVVRASCIFHLWCVWMFSLRLFFFNNIFFVFSSSLQYCWTEALSNSILICSIACILIASPECIWMDVCIHAMTAAALHILIAAWKKKNTRKENISLRDSWKYIAYLWTQISPTVKDSDALWFGILWFCVHYIFMQFNYMCWLLMYMIYFIKI